MVSSRRQTKSVASNKKRCTICGTRKDRHKGKKLSKPSAAQSYEHANRFLRATAAHMMNPASTFNAEAVELASTIGVGADLPTMVRTKLSSLRDSFFAHDHDLLWNKSCELKWCRILDSPIDALTAVAEPVAKMEWLPTVVQVALDKISTGAGIIPYPILSNEILRLKDKELKWVSGATQKKWRETIGASLETYGISIAGSTSTGYYVWTDKLKDNAAHHIYTSLQKVQEGADMVDFVATSTNHILTDQNDDVLLNDAAMRIHAKLAESKPTKKEAFYGPGITMESCLDYIGGSTIPAFLCAVLSGATYDTSQYDRLAQQDTMDEASDDDNDDNDDDGSVVVGHKETKEYFQAVSLASSLMMCFSNIPGPWQAATSNEFRAGNVPKRIQDKAAMFGFSGNARYSREQENAYAADSDSTAMGTLIATALEHVGEIVVCVSSDNCDWENGGSSDGNAGTHIINLEARNVLLCGEAPEMVESSRKSGPLVGTAPPIEDETPERAPIVAKTSPDEASAAAQASVMARINVDAKDYMHNSQREDLAWVCTGIAHDGTIKPGHPEWTVFMKHIRNGKPIPKLDSQLPLAPIMLDPVSPEGIKAILERCMLLKRETKALAVFLDCDVGEWQKIAQQLFKSEYEKHIILMQGGFHTATKVRALCSNVGRVRAKQT